MVGDVCKEVADKKLPFPERWATGYIVSESVLWNNLIQYKPGQVCPFENIKVLNVSEQRESMLEIDLGDSEKFVFFE